MKFVGLARGQTPASQSLNFKNYETKPIWDGDGQDENPSGGRMNASRRAAEIAGGNNFPLARVRGRIIGGRDEFVKGGQETDAD